VYFEQFRFLAANSHAVRLFGSGQESTILEELGREASVIYNYNKANHNIFNEYNS
jgi:hypothetical protein